MLIQSVPAELFSVSRSSLLIILNKPRRLLT
jgi:hypothetical protein